MQHVQIVQVALLHEVCKMRLTCIQAVEEEDDAVSAIAGSA